MNSDLKDCQTNEDNVEFNLIKVFVEKEKIWINIVQ